MFIFVLPFKWSLTAIFWVCSRVEAPMRSSYSVVGEFITVFNAVLVVHIDHLDVTINLNARSIIPSVLENPQLLLRFINPRLHPLFGGNFGALSPNSADLVTLFELPNGFQFTGVESRNFPAARVLCGGQRRRFITKYKVVCYFLVSEACQGNNAFNEKIGEGGLMTLPMSDFLESSEKLFSSMGSCMGTCNLRSAGIRKWKECYFDSDSCITINAILEGKKNPILEIDDTMCGDFPNWFFMIIKSSRTDNILAHNTVEYQRILFEDPVFGVFPILFLVYIPVVFVVAFLVVVVCVAVPVGF